MVRFVKYKGRTDILRCVKGGDDEERRVVAILGAYKALRDVGLVARSGAGDDSVWLVIDAKTKDVREVPDKRRAWNWCVYVYEDGGADND